MRNWIAPRYSVARRARQRVNDAIFDIAERFPRVLPGVHEISRRWNSKSDRIAAPDQLAIRPLHLAFSDLYLVEEFERLGHGVRRLLRVAPGLFRPREDNPWLGDPEGRTLSYQNLGWIDLSRLPRSIRPKYLGNVAVTAVNSTPSTRMLSFVTSFTPAFDDEFRRLVTTDGGERVELGWVRQHGFVAERMTPAWIERKVAYDELFLAANKEMTRILRRYVRVGRAMEGPLQAIEVLAIDAALSTVPEEWPQRENDADNSNFARAVFFQTLGRRSPSFGREYRLPWAALYPVDRYAAYDINSYQLLVSTSSYAEYQPAERTARDTESDVRHDLWYRLPRISAMLALQNFYRQLRRAALAARDEIAPLVGGAASARRIRHGHQKMAKANALFFRETRVWTEFGNKFARGFLTKECEAFTRTAKDVATIPEGNLAHDFWPSIEQHHMFCQEQLELLRAAFSEVLAYATLVTNDRLQRVVLWLSVIATIAALLAVPDTVWTWIVGITGM